MVYPQQLKPEPFSAPQRHDHHKPNNTPTHKRKSRQQPENTPYPNAETKNQSHQPGGYDF